MSRSSNKNIERGIEPEQETKAKRFLMATASLSAVMAASMATCIFLSIIDLASLHLKPQRSIRLVYDVLPALALATGAILGVGAWFIGAGIRRMTGKKHFVKAASLFAALALSPFCFILAKGVFSGAGISKMISPVYSIPAATVMFSLSAGLAVGIGGWLWGRAFRDELDRVSWALAFIGFPGFVMALHWINAHAFVRLYPEIHKAQTWVTWAVGTFFFGLLLAPALRTKRRRSILTISGGGLVLAAVIGFLGAKPTWTSHEVRFLLVDGTVLGKEVVELLTLKHKPGRYLAASKAQKRQEHEREGMLVLPGASVLLITVDALRPDKMGVYSPNSRLTPNLDNWARNAVVFKRAYCQSPHSSYSLSALHTGEPVRSLVALKQPLPRPIASLLKEKDYSTKAYCTMGVFHTEGEKLRYYEKNKFGFNDFDPNGYYAKDLTDRAIFALNELSSRGKSFLLWTHYFDPHEPYRRHKEFDFGNEPQERYDSEVAYADGHVARLIAHARSSVENLIVIFTADHGEEFGEHGGFYHGNSLYEEQVKVPLIIDIPGVSSGTVDIPVSLIDLAPTLLDVLGIEPPHRLKGRSLVARMLGHNPPAKPVFGEVSTKRMVVSGDLKLIVDTWRRTVELYDLKNDPGERRNLVESRPRRVAELHRLLNENMAQLSSANQDLPRALAVARLGGEKAQEGLCSLVKDNDVDQKHRIEGIRRLAKMKGGCSPSALEEVMLSSTDDLSQEATIALGELERREAETALRVLMAGSDNPDIRHRAAVAAGRCKMKSAAPYLIEALYSSNRRAGYRASHYLGYVGGKEAVAPLMHVAVHNRRSAHLTAVALGQIGYRTEPVTSKGILAFLTHWASQESSEHILSAVIKGIGLLGNPSASQLLKQYLHREDLMESREALVRTGAWGAESGFWGTDFPPQREPAAKLNESHEQDSEEDPSPQASILTGKKECKTKMTWLSFSFLHRTYCVMKPRFSFEFHYDLTKNTISDKPVTSHWEAVTGPSQKHYSLLITVRPKAGRKEQKAEGKEPKAEGKELNTADTKLNTAGKDTPSPNLNLTINDHSLKQRKLRSGWQELRWEIKPAMLQPGINEVKITAENTDEIEVDHFIIW